jgi:DNA mismatch endonuclease (patch repair protein)
MALCVPWLVIVLGGCCPRTWSPEATRWVVPVRGGPDLVSSGTAVSDRMSRQRRVGTTPELALRRLLHARGHRYRVAWPVPKAPRRSIDVAFVGRRLAVFVDGCFWHACPVHASNPRANAEWWAAKLRKNVQRDQETNELLYEAGWTVVRIWEHEHPEEALLRVELALASLPSVANARLRRNTGCVAPEE